ncbi:15235_t:CDS:2, partial [Acaulospora colombiana]
CRELSKTVEVPSQLEYVASKSYGKPINIGDLLQQSEVSQTNGGSIISSPQRNLPSHELFPSSWQTPSQTPSDVPKETTTSNPYISPKSISQRHPSSSTETMPHDKNSSFPFSNNQGDSNANTLATSLALFGTSSPGLQRSQVLDASIASLPTFSDGNKKILSKTEFTQRYLHLIQV